MLTISEPLLQAFTRDSFVNNILAFLQSKTSDGPMLSYLTDKKACETLWEPLFEDINAISEHSLAVRVTYRLACETKSLRPKLLEHEPDEGEIAMMMQLEHWQILRFADWDK